MKYRLDSARKNKTRLRRKFITTPAKKKPSVKRKRKRNWMVIIVFVGYLLGIAGIGYIYTQRPVIEHRTTLLMEQPQIPLVPPLVSESAPGPRTEKAPKVIKRDTSKCYMARRDGHYFMDCNWVCKGKC